VLEAPLAHQAASHLARSPDAVLVCNDVPPSDCWEHRRVVLLDGVDDHDVARIVANGASVSRPARGSVQNLLDAAFGVEPGVPASALEDPAEPAPAPPLLTRRQLEVVGLIAQGMTSHEIADGLGVRPKTVENYKQRLFSRLGVQNQAHAVARCARLGLLEDRPLATIAS
jgi:DNA-binding NarL/FixJ family response regulator